MSEQHKDHKAAPLENAVGIIPCWLDSVRDKGVLQCWIRLHVSHCAESGYESVSYNNNNGCIEELASPDTKPLLNDTEFVL